EVIIDLADYLDDKVGLYGTAFHQLGTASVVAPYRRVQVFMADGGGLVSTIDDEDFFSQTHPQRPKEIGGTDWSNDLVQAGGLTFTSFAESWAAMCAFPGEDGFTVGSRPTHLVIEPTDFGIAMDICFSDKPSGLSGGGNPWRGLVTPVVVPEWKGLDIYQLLDCTSTIDRPFIFQEREALKLRPIYTNVEDPWVRDNGKMKWNLQGRHNVGLGNPRRALRSRKT
ncbi:MAG: Mu-like prophage major head subunit gpT family protein, partial [Byssovorax sp.]